jgi:hypothetical protein
LLVNKHYYFNFIIFYAGEINTPANDAIAVGVAYLWDVVQIVSMRIKHIMDSLHYRSTCNRYLQDGCR